MKKNKVIFSNYDDLNNPYYSGGGARVIHEIAKRLTDRYEVIVYTGSYNGSENITHDSVSYKRVGFSFFGPKISQILFPVFLIRHVVKNDYVIWIENFSPPFSFSLLPLLTKNSWIGFAQMLAGSDMQRKYKLPFRTIEEIGLKLYKNIITLTENDANKLYSINPKYNIRTIPLGVDIPNIRKKIPEKHLLYIGRIEVNQKGLDLLIDAYSKSDLMGKVPLVIAGTGIKTEVDLLKNQIKNKKLTEFVNLVGRVSGKKKNELFLQAYAVVIPSRFETFSLTALESMAYGKPVIAFDISGLSWIPNNLITKCKNIDSNSLSRGINNVINNESMRLKIGKASREFALKFNWDSVGKQYLEFINTKVK